MLGKLGARRSTDEGEETGANLAENILGLKRTASSPSRQKAQQQRRLSFFGLGESSKERSLSTGNGGEGGRATSAFVQWPEWGQNSKQNMEAKTGGGEGISGILPLENSFKTTDGERSTVQEVEPLPQDHHFANISRSESNPPRRERPYRGFSTSICNLFRSPRVGCCSIACFGILQADRTRFLLTGRYPPSLSRRICIHLIVPIGLFMMAGYCAQTIDDPNVNQFFSTLFLFGCIGYVVGMCFRSVNKRADLREEMLLKLDELDLVAATAAGKSAPACQSSEVWTLPQTRADMSAAHRSFGLFYEGDVVVTDQLEEEVNFCTCMWDVVSKACCGLLLKRYFQCCGLCAIAQEGREMEIQIPIHRRMFDYITFEPFLMYAPAIRALRRTQDGTILKHFQSLSSLSLSLFRTLLAAILALMVIGFVYHGMRLADSVIFAVTFFQGFLVLYLVHWRWHKFDLSVDAVIKYFACGFVLTAGLALFFEFVEYIFLRVSLIYASRHINLDILVDEDGFTSSGNDGNNRKMLADDGMSFAESLSAAVSGGRDYAYMVAFSRQHVFVFILYTIISSFVYSALIEEVCKYFGFKMVDHPDFSAEEDLAASSTVSPTLIDNDEIVRGTSGEAAYGMDTSDDSSEEERNGPSPINDVVTDARMSPVPRRSRFSCLPAAAAAVNNKDEPMSYVAHPPRSGQSVSAAITVAMVTVAVGFACCESLLYIFVYSRSTSIRSEIIVLLSRSLLPIHPLAAAIQSIGVCRREVEYDGNCTFGRGVILPAVLIHGTFDFLLTVIPFWFSLGQVDDSNSATCKVLVIVLSGLVLAVGAVYYMKQSEQQRRRIASMDETKSYVGIRSLMIV